MHKDTEAYLYDLVSTLLVFLFGVAVGMGVMVCYAPL
jgi:hypothetical protein